MTSRAPSFAGRAYLAASIVAILLVLSVIAIAVFVGTTHGALWRLQQNYLAEPSGSLRAGAD